MSELIKVPFYEDELDCIARDGHEWASLHRACENMGIDANAQRKRLNRKPWARTSVMEVQMANDTQRRTVFFVRRDCLPMWLATIDASRLPDDVRPKVELYQRECATVLNDYWAKGGSINPRATDEQLAALQLKIAEQGFRLETWAARRTVLVEAMGEEWYKLHLEQIASRVHGSEPAKSRCLTVSDYLEDKGLSQSEAARLASSFGKKLKGLYIQERKKTPPTTERIVGGAPRHVVAYSDDDRSLFDRVFEQVKVSG